MTLIATTDSLREICARFAAHDFVTVDTEFLRETTFWPQVCVIQIATDDEAVAARPGPAAPALPLGATTAAGAAGGPGPGPTGPLPPSARKSCAVSR